MPHAIKLGYVCHEVPGVFRRAGGRAIRCIPRWGGGVRVFKLILGVFGLFLGGVLSVEGIGQPGENSVRFELLSLTVDSRPIRCFNVSALH